MDFIDGLPISNDKYVIFVIIDRLSKYAHFIAMWHPYTATTVAQAFLDHIFIFPDMLTLIGSDRHVNFFSKFL